MALTEKRRALAEVQAARPGISAREAGEAAGYGRGARVRVAEAEKDPDFLAYRATLTGAVVAKVEQIVGEVGYRVLDRINKVAEHCEGMVEHVITTETRRGKDEGGEPIAQTIKVSTEEMRNPREALKGLELLGRAEGEFDKGDADRPMAPAFYIIRADQDPETYEPIKTVVGPAESQTIPPLPSN